VRPRLREPSSPSHMLTGNNSGRPGAAMRRMSLKNGHRLSPRRPSSMQPLSAAAIPRRTHLPGSSFFASSRTSEPSHTLGLPAAHDKVMDCSRDFVVGIGSDRNRNSGNAATRTPWVRSIFEASLTQNELILAQALDRYPARQGAAPTCARAPIGRRRRVQAALRKTSQPVCER